MPNIEITELTPDTTPQSTELLLGYDPGAPTMPKLYAIGDVTATTWRGTYSGATAYIRGDLVAYSGATYRASQATTGNLPTNTTYWEVVAAKGDTGATGAQGPAGTNGTNGTNGAPGADGADGADGEDGASAYEVAVANGFVGNEAAWLASLVGPEGPQGEQGPAGADGADGAPGADGADGATGATGATGPAGADGKTVRYGTGAPSDALGVDGDFYIATNTNTIYGPKAAGAWPSGTSLVGPQGPAGADGAGLTNGDKGDITVASSGASLTIDNDAVTYAKMQNVSAASKLLGRGSASGAGDVEEITVGSGLTMTGTTLSASGGGVSSGTAFPGSPSTNDLYFRTDLGWICYYDGTRWLTAQEFVIHAGYIGPSGSTGAIYRTSLRTDYAPLFTRAVVNVLVNTTNSGVNYWSYVLRAATTDYASTTVADTRTTAALSAGTWSKIEGAPTGTTAPTNRSQVYLDVSKTGSPGSYEIEASYWYRLIVT